MYNILSFGRSSVFVMPCFLFLVPIANPTFILLLVIKDYDDFFLFVFPLKHHSENVLRVL